MSEDVLEHQGIETILPFHAWLIEHGFCRVEVHWIKGDAHGPSRVMVYASVPRDVLILQAKDKATAMHKRRRDFERAARRMFEGHIVSVKPHSGGALLSAWVVI